MSILNRKCIRDTTIEELPKGISFDEYLYWREAASVARNKYIKGELTAEEALKIIEVND